MISLRNLYIYKEIKTIFKIFNTLNEMYKDTFIRYDNVTNYNISFVLFINK